MRVDSTTVFRSDSGPDEALKKILLSMAFVLLCLLDFLTFSPAYAGDAILSWDPNTEPDLASYKVYYGTTSGSYGVSVDAGNVITYTVTNLSANTTYYFAVKAYNTSGNESGYSNEVFKTIPAVADTTSPVISGIAAGSITSSGAVITWTTNEPSTTQIAYGTTVSLGSLSPEVSTLVASHSVTLVGLNPNTTYHFKVLSVDGAGNGVLSNENIFVTLQASQSDQPAAIQDLRVQTGSSSRNSAVLEWTATGADGTVGTATLYDLRMSKMRIVENGLTPNSGEVTFSNATSVSGVPVPQPSGTLQSITVDGLETNTVYYFAIQAIDDKGNKSPLSNVVNAYNVPPLPVTAVRQGYTMISFPMVPITTDVQTLLGNIVGTPVELSWWSSSGLPDGSGTFVTETNVVPGYGYILKSEMTNAVLNLSGTLVTDPSRAVPVQTGWNIIGNPYATEVVLRNTQIRNVGTDEVKTFEEAVIAGWVGNAIYHFNGSTYDYVSYEDATLKLWQGYWLAVLGDGMYELVITKP